MDRMPRTPAAGQALTLGRASCFLRRTPVPCRAWAPPRDPAIRRSRQTIDQQLAQGERVFRQLLAQNQSRLEHGAAILSADFAFKKAIATNDSGTILSVVRNHAARVGANVMTLVSLEKVVRADTLDPDRVGKPFAFPELIGGRRGRGQDLVGGIRVAALSAVVVPVLGPIRSRGLGSRSKSTMRWRRSCPVPASR
jgi:hypothetical protein